MEIINRERLTDAAVWRVGAARETSARREREQRRAAEQCAAGGAVRDAEAGAGSARVIAEHEQHTRARHCERRRRGELAVAGGNGRAGRGRRHDWDWEDSGAAEAHERCAARRVADLDILVDAIGRVA